MDYVEKNSSLSPLGEKYTLSPTYWNIGRYWNIYIVTVLPNPGMFMRSRTWQYCCIANNTGTQTCASIVSNARTRRVSALNKHQNWSESALFCHNS